MHSLSCCKRDSMIVGLAGKARSGKDTVGSHLINDHGFHHTYFAKSLKEACRSIFHLTHAELWGEDKGRRNDFWDATPRHLLQQVGTEVMRTHFDPEIWVKSVECEIRQWPTHNWVITDVRFPNEAEAVKRWGGRVYRIVRPGAEDEIEPEAAAHSSETALDDYESWDGIILNDWDIPALLQRVRQVIGLT